MRYVIEFEGYPIKSSFVFKEVTAVNLETLEVLHFFIKSPFQRKNIQYHDQKIVRYCETFLHRIKWHAGRSYMKEFVDFIKRIPCDSQLFTKGQQKVDLLSKYCTHCTIHDLEENGCPAITKIHNVQVNTCPLSFHANSLNCSHIKAITFSKFLLKVQNE